MKTVRYILAAPNIDGTDVGEAFVAFKWAEALSSLVDLTVLSFERSERKPLQDQLPDARVVSWREPEWLRRHERFNAMAKPGYPIWSFRVRNWLRTALANGEKFDLVHQIMPQAMRYASPFRHFDIPYIIGPLGGALSTPEKFQSEVGTAPFFTQFRRLDRFRLHHDPWLRASYGKAAAVLGVAPYVRDMLRDIPIQRFEAVLELGIDAPANPKPKTYVDGALKLLHVGRGVRTKGLRDLVRAMARLEDMREVTLTSAGSGEEVEICRAEAKRLNVSDRVSFLGRVPRAEVEHLYRNHDVFVFPSFREPAGGVLYEAMRWGMPIITVDRGGPGWIVDDSCGIRLPVVSPQLLSRDLEIAIRKLATSPELRIKLGQGSLKKVTKEGLWPKKAQRIVDLSRQIIANPSQNFQKVA